MIRRCCALALVLGAAGCSTDLTLIPASRPGQVTAISHGGYVSLFWEDVPGASGYGVYAGRKFDDQSGLPLPPVGPGDYEERGGTFVETPHAYSGSEFVDNRSDLPTSFTVVAFRGNGVSEPSDEVLAWPHAPYYGELPVWLAQSTGGFGAAISGIGDINDDGYQDVAIGAPWTALTTTADGSVYVYAGSPTGLSLLSRIDGEPGSRTGSALAFSGTWANDEERVLIGAPGAERVYVVDGSSLVDVGLGVGVLPFAEMVLSMGTNFSGSFGSTIVDAGNLDGALVPFRAEVAVGAPDLGAGAVFIFRGYETPAVPPVLPGAIDVSPTLVICLDGAMQPVKTGDAADCAAGSARLGASLAAAGNLANDPWDDLIIGAPYYGTDGAVVFFEGVPALAVSSAGSAGLTLALGPPSGGARFGAAVASAGDADGDDLEEVAIGAPGHDESASKEDVGRVYVFSGIPTSIPAPSPTPAGVELRDGDVAGSRFGGSLLGVPDFAESPTGLLVGMPRKRDDSASSPEGALPFPLVQSFYPDPVGDTLSILENSLTTFAAPGDAPPAVPGDRASVGIGGADVNGDGVTDILVADSASGAVALYMSIPQEGFQVAAGPLYETVVNEPFWLSLASLIDPSGAEHTCFIEWDVQADTLTVPVREDSTPCTDESIRSGVPETMRTVYPAPGEYVVRLTVFARDGRKGQAFTRVVVGEDQP